MKSTRGHEYVFFRCGESRNFKDWNTYIIKLSQRIDEMKDDETKKNVKRH